MKNSKTLGRPRGFDPELALLNAVELFWQKGYADASLSDLTEVMGINRPSLYATYGDKESLFLKVVEAYRDIVAARIDTVFAADRSLEEVLYNLFEAAISLYATPKSAPRGCLLASAATAEAPQSRAIQTAVRRALQAVEDSIRRGLLSRQARDSVSSCRMETMTLLTSSFCYALSVRARLGVAEDRLKSSVPVFVDSVLAARR